MDFTFKSAGRPTTDVLSEQSSDKIRLDTEIPIGIMTPMRHSIHGHQQSIFAMHYDIIDQVADNLRNLIQTNHGERLGRPRYGANLRPLSLEILGHAKFESEAMTRISSSVSKYLPFVNLKTMSTKRLPPGTEGVKNPMIIIRLEYTVKNLHKKRALEVLLTLAG